MFKGLFSSGDEMIDKLLYMSFAIMILFIVIFFVVPELAHAFSISY